MGLVPPRFIPPIIQGEQGIELVPAPFYDPNRAFPFGLRAGITAQEFSDAIIAAFGHKTPVYERVPWGEMLYADPDWKPRK